MRRLALSVLGLVLAITAHAQDDPGAVAADRPGFGDGSAIVAPGRFQIEAGYTYTDLGDATLHTIGQVVMRVGVTSRIELRALFNSFVVFDGPRETVSGSEDRGLGVKARLYTAPSGMALSGQLAATFPTGSDAFTADEIRSEVKLILDAPLTSTVGFSGNAGLAFGFEEGPLVFLTYVSLATSVPGIDGLGVFAGLFSLFPDEEDSDHGVDAGLVYLLNAATQLDVNFGTGLTDNQSDFFIGAGIARRF